MVSAVEDFPVLHSARALEGQGLKVSHLKVDQEARVDLDALHELIDDNTLVSVQHANQEVGTVQDVAAVADICEDEGSLFHTDATHTFGRLLLDLSSLRADMVTMAAHTVHGPKGIGALYLRDGTPMGKWMDGGFQENDRRAGLENIPGAVGFARAVELIDREENVRLASMRDRVIDRVLGEVPHTTLNGGREGIPQNANLTFHYVEGGSITLHLDMRGFAVSTGSACFSKSLEASHVIMAMGGDHERAHGSIRFTFGRFNTMEEADAVVDAVSEVVHRLREISPLGKEVEE